jgi:hypothetical protein
MFNASKDAGGGGGPRLDRLAADIDQRMSCAALSHSS